MVIPRLVTAQAETGASPVQGESRLLIFKRFHWHYRPRVLARKTGTLRERIGHGEFKQQGRTSQPSIWREGLSHATAFRSECCESSAQMHTHTHTREHTLRQVYSQTLTQTHTQYTHTHRYMHVPTHRHARRIMQVHTHTHTRVPQIDVLFLGWLLNLTFVAVCYWTCREILFLDRVNLANTHKHSPRIR